MERVILIGSLLLNVVLLLVIFFRTALNEILVKWWTRRQDRKDETRMSLLELYRVMNTFVGDYFMSLVLIATEAANAPEAGKKVIGVQEFLAAHELKFPPVIRGLVAQLRKEMILPGGLADLRRDAIIARSEAVTRVVQEIQEEVARFVS